MGNKRIINLDDNTQTVIEVGTSKLGMTTIGSKPVCYLQPYNEPDNNTCINFLRESGWLQDHDKQITESEYKRGYKDGTEAIVTADEAWEAARKIGGMSTEEQKKLFGCFGLYFIAHEFSVSEAIAKIRQYEQKKKQKEKIKAGDVVWHKKHPEIKIWVIYVDDCDNQMITGVAIESVNGCCKVGEAYINRDAKDWEKTGEHYNVAEYLRKIREEK